MFHRKLERLMMVIMLIMMIRNDGHGDNAEKETFKDQKDQKEENDMKKCIKERTIILPGLSEVHVNKEAMERITRRTSQ